VTDWGLWVLAPHGARSRSSTGGPFASMMTSAVSSPKPRKCTVVRQGGRVPRAGTSDRFSSTATPLYRYPDRSRIFRRDPRDTENRVHESGFSQRGSLSVASAQARVTGPAYTKSAMYMPVCCEQLLCIKRQHLQRVLAGALRASFPLNAALTGGEAAAAVEASGQMRLQKIASPLVGNR
jgi:hypothetical protein